MSLRKNATVYYDSTTRSNKYGNNCSSCQISIDDGTHVKRCNMGVNSYGRTQYSMVCIDCWNKLLPDEIQKSKDSLTSYIIEEERKIRELEQSI